MANKTPPPRPALAPMPVRILRDPEVYHVTGLKLSRRGVLEREGNFPRRVKIGKRASGWIEAEVLQWVWKRIEASRDGTVEVEALPGLKQNSASKKPAARA